MKKFIALWIVSFMALSSLSAGNVITYTATEKLPETANPDENAIGLYIYGFNTDILSHTFLDGVGTITFSDDVTSIRYKAFYYCTGLTSITIPNSVKSIGYEAFYGCTGLTSITIPNSVTDIVYGAFSGCDGLTSIIVESGNTIYDNRNNCNAIIETATNTLIQGCNTTVIPNNVTSIENEAFSGCTGLTSITIPNSVTKIGYEAFYGCTGLTSITIPNSVTSIEYKTFSGCTGLTSITIPNSVTDIGYRAFSGCTGLTSITIPNSVAEIGGDAFSGCTGLTSITIPNSVKGIGDGAFVGCNNLKSVSINSDSIVSVNRDDTSSISSIFGSQVTEYILGDDVHSIGDYTFYKNVNLISVSIGNSVTSIGYHAFEGCTGLTSVTIGNSVTSIGMYAFEYCTGLTSITIPNSVTSIEYGAFWHCNNLKSVSINSDSIVSVNRDYPSSISSIFGLQVTEYILGDDVHSIGNYTFYKNVNLISVSIGNSVTSIGENAFEGCTGLTSITIPNSVTSIGDAAFYYCTGLTSITIPNSVTSIDSYAFLGCTGLTSITIPNSVTSIGYGSFWSCNNLKSVSINSDSIVSVNRTRNKTIGSIFGSQVTEYILGDDVHSIGDCTFYEKVNLISVSIGNSVTSIGGSAFAGCTGLTSITIPNSVTSIGTGAFSDCTGLTSITSRAITPPKRDSYTFNKVPTTISVYIPCGTKEAYQSAWGYFQNYIEESEHTLAVTTQNEDMGAVQVIQEPSCPDGNSVFKAVANKGYHFVQWNDGNTDNPRTVAVIQDTTFVAEFAPGSAEYTITVTCNSQQGTVSGSGVYAEGTLVTLTATAYKHYNFTQWTDGNTDNPRKITAERDATYTAEFAIDQHFITATCDPQQGSITGTGTYDYGTLVTLTATANNGYEFLQWSNGIKDNPYSFTVVDNITLEAQFIPTTAVENVSANDDTTLRKVLRDGQVYILRNGKVYTIQGQEIKE